MNWKTRYDGFKPCDKVRITGDDHADEYKLGNVYTLNHHYIKNGVWQPPYDYVDTQGGDNCNYWDTEEHDTGIEKGSMELFLE